MHVRTRPDGPDQVDRELRELAPEELADCEPSQDWSDLLSAVLFIAQEQKLGEVALCRAAFYATETPAEGARSLLEAVWDQAVVLPDVGPDGETT